MGKNKKKPGLPDENHLVLPNHPSTASPHSPTIVDTHTHLLSTFSLYKSKYPDGKHATVFDFVQTLYRDRKVEAIVDVWCEAPVTASWKEMADSALTQEGKLNKWGGIDYWFVMALIRHDAKSYDNQVEQDILDAMTHPRCVGWGEIGLDYHYDNSPRDLQQVVLVRQIRHAVKLGKPLTIHTREAEDDTERILKAEVPREHKIHIHCFTDTPEFARRLLDHFPNLYIGVTGVISYSTNLNTSALVRSLMAAHQAPRILLETDAPFMVPSNIYSSLTDLRGKLPFSHTAMIPWTSDFVAQVAGQGWDCDKIMSLNRKNANLVYGI